MFTVLFTKRYRPQATQPPWLIVEPESRAALAIENVLSKLGWSVLGPIADADNALPLARQHRLAGAVLDLKAEPERVYPVAEMLAQRHIPFVFITEGGREELREDFRDYPSLPKRFLMERLRPLLRGLMAAPA
jgi:CheY-like chemotaxis protein